MGIFSKKQAVQTSFIADYHNQVLNAIEVAEEEIKGLEDEAEDLAEQINELIRQRQKVVFDRQELIRFVGNQRQAVGLEVVDYDAPEEDVVEVKFTTPVTDDVE